MAEMLGKLPVDIAADFRARLVRVNDEPVGFHDGGRWNRAGRWNLTLISPMLRTGTTRQKTEEKDADDGDDNEWFDVHAVNSREICAGHKESF
jgi:hypothetical protein